MKIGVDATELRNGARGGVATALRLLLDALRNCAPDIEFQALAPEPVETPRGIRCVATGGPRRPLFWRRSRQLRRHLRGLDLFHSPVTAFPDTGIPDLGFHYPITEFPFLRGDTNGSGAVDIADAIHLLGALFIPGTALVCEDSGDGNDDGSIDIADAITILSSLFLPGAPPLGAPFPNCGADPTADPVECDSPAGC